MPSLLGDDFIGQPALRRLLLAWIKSPAPAYLCFGPSHLGKRTFAERFVKLLLDRSIDDAHWRSHPDLVLLEAEEGKSQISVEQVRAARERLSMRPIAGPRLVVYVPFADRLNDSGTNALLKVLEEPPAGAVFVLVAEDPSRLPGTLKSRCVSVPFSTVPKAELISALVARGISSPQAESLASGAHGRPGLALEPLNLEDEKGITFAQAFMSVKTAGARFLAIENLAKACEGMEDAQTAWRDALQSAMQEVSKNWTQEPRRAMVFGLALIAALRSIGGPVSPRVPLEAGALQLNQRSDIRLSHLFPSFISSSLPSIYQPL